MGIKTQSESVCDRCVHTNEKYSAQHHLPMIAAANATVSPTISPTGVALSFSMSKTAGGVVLPLGISAVEHIFQDSITLYTCTVEPR